MAEKPTVGLLIDNSNIFRAIQNLREIKQFKGEIDYAKFLQYIESFGLLIHRRIYITDVEYQQQKNFEFFLKKELGFTAVTKKIKKIKNGHSVKYKCNFDVEIAVDAMDLIIQKSAPDKIILVSGDSDFEYLINTLLDYSIETIIISTRDSIASELLNIADNIIFIEDIWEIIKK